MSENNEQLNTRKFIFYFTFFLVSLSLSLLLFLPVAKNGIVGYNFMPWLISGIPTVVLFVTVKSFLR